MCVYMTDVDTSQRNGPKSGRKAALHIQRLRRQLRCARQAAAKYRGMIRQQRERSAYRQLSVEEIITAAGGYLEGPALSLLSCQLRQAGRKSRGRRWSPDDKLLALSIFHRSPSAYRFLSSYFLMPSVRSLRHYLHGLNFELGFCERVFSALQAKVSHMSEKDRLAVLCGY